MTTPFNIAIPPLSENQRIEVWQTIFIAATSALVANAGEKAAIQILQSFLIRHTAVALEALKEEILVQFQFLSQLDIFLNVRGYIFIG